MVEYLELDENSYIENDIVKSRLNEHIDCEKFISHDELWSRVTDIMLKVREYDETHNKHT